MPVGTLGTEQWFRFLQQQRRIGRWAVIEQAEAPRRRLGLPSGDRERARAEAERELRLRSLLIREAQSASLIRRPYTLMISAA